MLPCQKMYLLIFISCAYRIVKAVVRQIFFLAFEKFRLKNQGFFYGKEYCCKEFNLIMGTVCLTDSEIYRELTFMILFNHFIILYSGHLDRVVHGVTAEDILHACDQKQIVTTDITNPHISLAQALKRRNLATFRNMAQQKIQQVTNHDRSS